MTTANISVKLAIRRINRWPYYATRVLGPRADAGPWEFIVPLELKVNSEWLRHSSPTVRVSIEEPPPQPSAQVDPP